MFAIDLRGDRFGIFVQSESRPFRLEVVGLREDSVAAIECAIELRPILIGDDDFDEDLRERKLRPLFAFRQIVGNDLKRTGRPRRDRANDADHLNAACPRQLFARDEAESEERVAEGLVLFALGERLLDVIARYFARAQKNLVDAVGAIVRARRQNVAAFEINDLDDAVVLETNGSREALP